VVNVLDGSGNGQAHDQERVSVRPRPLTEPIDTPALDGSFRLLFAGHPDPMWVYDLATLEFVEVNDAAIELYGYAREEFLRMRITDIRPHEDVPALLENIAQERPSFQRSGIWRHMLQDGRLIDAEVTSHTIDLDGRRCVLVAVQDVTERLRAERSLTCQYAVNHVLAEAESLFEAAPRALRAICECLGWQVGAIWVPDDDHVTLRRAGTWHEDAVDLAEFDTKSFGFAPAIGEGLPGRVWMKRKPIWVEDLATDPAPPWAPLAGAAGLHAALALPIELGGEVLGVLEFLSRDGRPPDRALLEMMQGLGRQIGQFIHRKEAEARHQHQASIVESSDDAIVGKSLDGTIRSWNAGAAKIYGYSAEEVIGRSISLLTPPDRVDELRDILARIGRGEPVDRLQTVRVTKDGRKLHMSLTISPIRNGQGKVVGASAIARDVTEQRRAEDDLRASEARKGAMLEAALDCMVTMDHRGTITDFNPAAETTFGYSQAQAVGAEMAELIIPPMLRDRHRAGLARYLATGEGPVLGQRLEMPAMRADGTEFPAELAIARVPHIDPPVFIAYIRDITRRKLAEHERLQLLEQERAARREAEADRRRLAFLAEAGGLIAASLDSDATLRRVAWLAVSQIADWCVIDVVEDGELRRVALEHRDPEMVQWARDLQVRHPPVPDAPRGVANVVRTGKSEVYAAITDELLVESTDDPKVLEILRQLNLRSVMIVPLLARGQTLGAITFCSSDSGRSYGPEDVALAEELARHAGQAIDNTRLFSETQARAEDVLRLNEELEARVAARTAELEAANKELEAFSYSVSHDLRAPLRAIDGFSRILLTDFAEGLPDDGREYLRIVREGAQQMGRLIDDLLAFARLSRQPLKRRPVDPAELVRRCIEDLSADQEGRDVDVAILDLPPCSGDPAMLQQAFANLLSNAFKFTRRRAQARIEVGSLEQHGRRVYYVRDNGVGFDMRYAEKLFGVFQRLHNVEEYEGTGVGLAIVQRVIHRHGGRVWAHAEPDVGTTFYLTIDGSEPA
jgi:PAS domain S-box-containing protein